VKIYQNKLDNNKLVAIKKYHIQINIFDERQDHSSMLLEDRILKEHPHDFLIK
jgi:hypothetical protein